MLFVTADDDAWTRLAAAIPGLRIEQYDSADDVAERWNPARAAVVLVDARFDPSLARTVEQLQRHSTSLVPVALVDASCEDAAIALERQQALFEHVGIGLDPGTTLSVIERAGEEALARAALVPPGVSPSIKGSPPPRTPKAPKPALLGALAAAAVAIGAAGWWLTRDEPPVATLPAASTAGADAPAAAADAATAPLPATVEQIEDLLARARAAMRDKRYIDPDNDNALAHYRGVLAFEPDNGEARQGLARVAEVLVGRAETAMAARDYAGALRELEVARSLDPGHPRLAALDAQVNERVKELSVAQVQAALQANAFDRATALLRQAERTGALPPAQLATLRQEIARRQASAAQDELVRLAQVRISQGRLVEPPRDSARHYIGELQSLGAPAAAEVARLRQDFNRRALAEGRAAIARGAPAEAEPWLAELRAMGAPAAQVQALAREIREPPATRTGDAQRYAQLAQERLAQRRLIAPETDSALHYYRSLQSAEPRSAALPGLRDALSGALVADARAAFEGGRAADGRAALDAARELGVPAATLADVEASAGPKAPQAVTAPRLTRPLAPQYPARAAQRGTEGWADVTFVVSPEGVPEQVVAVAGEPEGVFAAAAIAAVKRARFEPARTADGTPVAQPTRLRVRFTLGN